MSARTHRKHVSLPPAGDLFSNSGEVMVVDANHELFSNVGIIGQRTQVIQLNNEMYMWLVSFTLDGPHRIRQEWMREDQLVANFPDK